MQHHFFVVWMDHSPISRLCGNILHYLQQISGYWVSDREQLRNYLSLLPGQHVKINSSSPVYLLE